MKKYSLLLLLFLMIAGFCYGQSMMTEEDAVKLVLRNNYDILVSRTSADIAKTNNTPGNAGMLPQVGIQAGDNYSIYNTSIDLQAGGNLSSPDTRANSFSATAELNWTLFDGGKMFITKRKLNEIENLGEINFRDKVSQTVYSVILAYYDVVRQKQQLASIREVIKYNEERVKILQASFNAGLVPKTDLLQAQVDLNVYLENAILQETVIMDSKRNLNQMLARDPDTQYEVMDSIDLVYHPDKNELTGKLFKQNTQLLSVSKQVDVANLSTKELIAQRYPWISVLADYNYLQTNTTLGSTLKNRSYGPLLGGTLTFPIYSGHKITTQIKVSRLEEQSATYVMNDIKNQVYTQLQNSLSDYNHIIQLLTLERANMLLAKENLSISMQRLRLGQTTSLEVRQAEESYSESLNRLIQFKYSAKVSETRLRQLVSEL